jgi:hypothetical protein
VKRRKSRKLEKATIIWGRAQIPRVSLSRSGPGASNEGEWGVARRRLVRWSCSGGTHRIQRLNGSSKSSRAKALMRRAKPTSCSLTYLRISKYPNHTDRFGGGDDGSVGSEFSEVDSAELRRPRPPSALCRCLKPLATFPEDWGRADRLYFFFPLVDQFGVAENSPLRSIGFLVKNTYKYALSISFRSRKNISPQRRDVQGHPSSQNGPPFSIGGVSYLLFIPPSSMIARAMESRSISRGSHSVGVFYDWGGALLTHLPHLSA